jgi:ABC-type transporter Mla maintaining outer membrane lipid asymmetry ATPase subunit MlaF
MDARPAACTGRLRGLIGKAMTLELRNVTQRMGTEIHVGDVSLTLERGSLNVLLGPTLSGKTTLLRVMAGLDVPTEGQVLIDGHDVTGLPVHRRWPWSIGSSSIFGFGHIHHCAKSHEYRFGIRRRARDCRSA